jgi:hypothetical protein
MRNWSGHGDVEKRTTWPNDQLRTCSAATDTSYTLRQSEWGASMTGLGKDHPLFSRSSGVLIPDGLLIILSMHLFFL